MRFVTIYIEGYSNLPLFSFDLWGWINSNPTARLTFSLLRGGSSGPVLQRPWIFQISVGRHKKPPHLFPENENEIVLISLSSFVVSNTFQWKEGHRRKLDNPLEIKHNNITEQETNKATDYMYLIINWWHLKLLYNWSCLTRLIFESVRYSSNSKRPRLFLTFSGSSRFWGEK